MEMKYSLFTFFFLSLISYLLFLPTARAQFNQPIATEVRVNLSPENPGPNQDVYASLESYTTDINAAAITWKVNGKMEKSGTGEKSFSFITGGFNTTTTVEITVVTREGETISQTLAIKPVAIDLMWQSSGFVPPFYKGKTLYSWQNPITFIALPHFFSSSGEEIPAKNLIYKWTRNGSVDAANSGYGLSTFTVFPDIISRPLNIRVEVTSPDSESVGRAAVTASPVDPSVILYKKSPLYGIEFQHAMEGAIPLSESKEITVIAEPFYFGSFDPSSPTLRYTWRVNGASLPSAFSRVQVFRQKEGVSGISLISLSLENSEKILQLADTRFNLKF